ncbi:MAG: hypothetical protein K8S99_01230 [Planctomycetes bacterium]|nr:hypothetical protein [Planctomycetota bacterium]
MAKRKRKRVSKTSARRPIHRPVDFQPLEPRTLLTTIFGGETFWYLDADQHTIQITVSGDAVVELIAGDVDTSTGGGAGSLIIGDIPGLITSSPFPGRTNAKLFGGLGGADGIRVLGTTPISDPEFAPGSIPRPNGGSAQINLDSLATSTVSGQSYSLNVADLALTQGTRRYVQLVSVNNNPDSVNAGHATVVANLQQATLSEDSVAQLDLSLNNVQDVSIDPTDGLMYVINSEAGGSRLYTVDRESGTVVSRGVITNTSTGKALTDVQAIAFNNAGQLYIMTGDYDGDPAADASGGTLTPASGQSPNTDPAIVIVNKNNGQFANSDAQPIVIDNNKTALAYTAMAFHPTQQTFYAVATDTVEATGVRRSTLHVFTPTTPGNTISPEVRGQIFSADLPVAVDGIAFTRSVDNTVALIGMDNSQSSDTGVLNSRLIAIPLGSVAGGNISVAALSEAGSVVTSRGLASYTVPGDTRPLLFTVAPNQTDIVSVIRGSAVTLPTDKVVGTSNVTRSGAAAFKPVVGSASDDMLYFVAESKNGVNNIDQLYYVDVNAGNRSQIQNSLTSIPGTLGESGGTPRNITALAWDKIGNDATLYAYDAESGKIGSATQAALDVSSNNINFVNAVTIRGTTVTNITGLAFVDENPIAAETQIWATQAGDSAPAGTTGDTGGPPQLLRVNLSTGAALQLGSLPEPLNTGPAGGTAGADLQGLTWNPTVINPFTGKPGALMAVDATSDHLVLLDARFRFPASDLFNIYVSQSSSDTDIQIAEKLVNAQGQPLVPFTGSIGAVNQTVIAVPRLVPEPIQPVSAALNTGTVLIGARTDTGDPKTSDIPVTVTGSSQSIGTRPSNLTGGSIYAGLTIGKSILEYASSAASLSSRTLDGTGNTITNVRHLAISRQDTMVALDEDGLGTNRQTLPGNASQIVTIDPDSGESTHVVTTSYNSNPLSGGGGMAYGDANFDGTQELYAVFSIGGQLSLGTLDSDTGVFTPVPGVDLSAFLGNTNAVSSMAFSPGAGSVAGTQGLYLLVNDGFGDQRLYEVTYTVDGDGVINSVLGAAALPSFTSAGSIVLGSIAFDAAGNLFGQDTRGGRLVSINKATGDLAATLITEAGSLRATVGAIAYDSTTDRFYAVDNALGAASSQVRGSGSGVLMKFVGTTSDSARGQNIGEFAVGGTIMGKVDASGSVGLFYAGWILTGNGQGQLLSATSPTVPQNFKVAGDLDQLVTQGTIGSDNVMDDARFILDYYTGFDMQIGGRLGGMITNGGFIGRVSVANAPLPAYVPERTVPYREYESHTFTIFADSPNAVFERSGLFAQDEFLNDTFDGAQRVGSIRPSTPGGSSTVVIQGTLQDQSRTGEMSDYYAVALQAGQKITAHIESFNPFVSLSLGVFDPEGRLVATDQNFGDGGDGTTFSFVADRPGEYRFATGAYIYDLTNDPPDEPFTPTTSDAPYEITIQNVGDIALGGIVVHENMLGVFSSSMVNVERGDLGGITVSKKLFAMGSVGGLSDGDLSLNPRIRTQQGSIRSVVAGQIATENDNYRGRNDIVVIDAGWDIGLVSTRTDLGGSGTGVVGTSGDAGVVLRSGHNVQTIDIAGQLLTDLQAKGALGVLRAKSMDSELVPSTIAVNSDSIGNDGKIDLISVDGDFGVIGVGGPQITTGPGGNVRYIEVGGELYQDSFFNSSQNSTIQVPAGQSFNFRDDSGGTIAISPTGQTPNPDYDSTVTGSSPTIPASLLIQPYNIRGSGGSVLVSIVATGSVSIRGNTLGNGGPVEIAKIQIDNANGAPVTLDTNGVPVQTAAANGATTDVSVNIGGDGIGAVDVLNVIGANFSNINNASGGELAGVRATSIGSLISAGTLGLVKSSTGAVVGGFNVLDTGDIFPFRKQRTGIVAGNIISARAGMGLGNFLLTGVLGSLTANSDLVDVPGVFEGINAPVYTSWNILSVQIGEGIADSGTGDPSLAGLYAVGNIGPITNQGLGSDIYGNVVAEGDLTVQNVPFGNGPNDKFGVLGITLNDGAIINAEILSINLVDSRAFIGNRTIKGNIGNITLNGRGGIIGSFFDASNIGNVSNPSGFGILNSAFSGPANATFGNFTAGGYGFRFDVIHGGSFVGNITATGDGSVLSNTAFTPSVRTSEIDPANGTVATDLAKVLDGQPKIAGLIRDVAFVAVGNMGQITAYRIDSTIPDDPALRSYFNVGNQIAGIKTTSTIDGLNVTTGNLALFMTGGDVSNMDLVVAGQIKTISINGSLLNSSSITAAGPNGNIGTATITGDFAGVLSADGRIGSLTVGGNLSGNITVRATNLGIYGLESLVVGGSFTNGGLVINGSVGTIQTAGSLGQLGDRLVIDGDLGNLIVGTDLSISNTIMGLSLLVNGDVLNANIRGSITGDIAIHGRLTKLTINANSTSPSPDLIAGDMQVGRGIGQAVINNGDIGGDITSGQGIDKFTLTNGSLLDTSTITSSFADITAFTIVNGDLLGDLRAPNGDIVKLAITGSDIGGNSLISARNIKSITIEGSILSGATIVATNLLDVLKIGGSIAAGASVSAGHGTSVTVGGDMLGALSYGHAAAGTKVSVTGDLGGSTSINANTTLAVGGNVADGSTVLIGRNLDQFTVGGTVMGNVLVNGTGGKWTLGAADGAVVTTGSDLKSLEVKGAFNSSVLQVGSAPGDDGAFSSTTGGKDLNESSRMAILSSFKAASMDTSIVASGGDIGTAAVSGAMNNSSISSGLSLGSGALAAVIANGSLASPDSARFGNDRELFRGDIKSATIGGGMTGSFITAGVDAGEGGDFSNPTVLLSQSGQRPLGGGRSAIAKVSALLDSNSAVLADSGIKSNGATGTGTVNANITYDVATNGSLLGGVALQTLVGSAAKSSPLSYVLNNGSTVTITVTGNGSVALYDEAGADTDNIIDTLLLTGTDAKTTVKIVTSTPNTASIARILTGDDAGINNLTFDGAISGVSGGTGPSLWNDGAMTSLVFNELGADFNGVVGGDVKTLTLGTQGPGNLRILGQVAKMTIGSGSGNSLLDALGSYVGKGFNAITANSVGAVYAHANGKVYLLDPAVTNGVISTTDVIDGFSGDNLNLLAMDFGPSDTLYGVAAVFNQSPTVRVGAMASALSDLHLSGMAVSPSGDVYAIQHFDSDGDNTPDFDRLVRIERTTGGVINVGRVLGFFGETYLNNLTQLAFDDSGNLFALTNDIDGTGPTTGTGVAIGRLAITPDSNGFVRLSGPTSTNLPPRLLDAGGVLNDFRGLAVNSSGTIYAIRRNLLDTGDQLVTISTSGTVTAVGANSGAILLDVDGDGTGETATDIHGIGFDEAGDIVVLNHRNGQSELVGLRSADLNTPTKFLLLLGGSELSNGLDSFAIGRNGDFSTFAYDQTTPGGLFFTNSDEAVVTLGTIDISGGPSNGRFSTLLPLAQDANGTSLGGNIQGMAIGAAGPGNVFIATTDGRLIRFNSDGSFHSAPGAFTDSVSGAPVEISTIVYNDATGLLLGVDPILNRIVTINPDTASISSNTSAGALAVDATNLAFVPTTGQVITFDTDTEQFIALRGTSESALSGITANMISTLNITGASSARVVGTNGLGKVAVGNNFTGTLSTPYAVASFTTGNNFNGSLAAGDDVKSVKFGNDVGGNGIVTTRRSMGSVSQSGGTFSGKLEAITSNAITVKGEMTNAALLRIVQAASGLTVNGDLEGRVLIGSMAGKGLSFKGDIGSNAQLVIGDDLKSLAIKGSVEQGSLISIDGLLTKLTIKGTDSGLIYARLGMGTADMGAADSAAFIAGLDIQSLTVRGNATDTVFASGLWLGDDLRFNTSDDLITGGSIVKTLVKGNFQDSVLAAGVLPSASAGEFTPGVSDNRFFTGNANADRIDQVDSADAGGFISSKLTSLTIQGAAIGTDVTNGRIAAAVAADGLGAPPKVGEFLGALRLRPTDSPYADPAGPPRFLEATRTNDREVRLVFSEQLNTGSLVASADGNNDGLFDSPGDVIGSIALSSNGVNISDVTLFYSTEKTPEGKIQSIVVIRRNSGDFPADMDVTLGGTDPVHSIYDRSGLRSTLRNPALLDSAPANGDAFGTVLDGDNDGVEGGNATFTV